MEKSIENIWKKGFEAEERLSVPVISNLYKKKSGLVIQKINSTAKKDNLSLIPVAIIISGVFMFIGKIVLGMYVALLLLALFVLNKKLLKKLENLDMKDSTYTYLLNYRSQVKYVMRYSTWLMGLGFPLVTIPGYWMFFRGSKVVHDFIQIDLGVQVLYILGLFAVLSLLGMLGYRLVTKIVYGKLHARLESTIEDMEV